MFFYGASRDGELSRMTHPPLIKSSLLRDNNEKNL